MKAPRKVSDGSWRWLERLRGLFRSSDVEREVHDEMAFHLEMEIRSRIEGGMTPEDARRSARLDFGSVENHRAAARDVRFGQFAERLLADVRLALRRLVRSPGFTAVTVLSMAVGAGAAIAIWSLVQATLFPQLPYQAPDDIVRIQTSWTGEDEADASPAEVVDFQAQLTDSFTAVGAYVTATANLITDDGPRKLPTAYLSHGVLEALGIEPALGRRFMLQEDRESAPLALLSHALWTSDFGADPDVVGRTVTIDAEPTEILGVLPPGAVLPESLLLAEPADLFLPLGLDPAAITSRGNHFLEVVARLRPGVDPGQVKARVEALGQSFVKDYDNYPDDMGFRTTTVPLTEWLRGPFVKPMAVLTAAVGFLLLVACANVAGLLLARTEERARELSMREALGAGRGRLVQQLATENALLAAIGGAGGLLTAGSLLRAMTSWVPERQSALIDPSLNFDLVLGALAVSLATGFVFGVLPVFHLRGRSSARALRGTRSATASLGGRRARQWLMVAQVAIALVVLSVAGLLGRSFVRLLDVDPGYRTEGLVTTQVAMSRADVSDQDILEFWRRLVAEVDQAPEVRAASSAVYLVLGGSRGDINFEVEGRPVPENQRKPAADWQVVSPGYFDLLEISPQAGRVLDERDADGAPGVVVVNETFAERTFPDAKSPAEVLGRRIHLGGQKTQPATPTIVGVVPDIRTAALHQPKRPQMYFTHAQFRFWSSGEPAGAMNLLVDSRLGHDDTRKLLESIVHRIDPALPLSQLRTLEEVRYASVSMPRLLAASLGTFAAATLFLTMVGLYGVVSESVIRRLPELGVRRALGAEAADLSRLVVGEGLHLFAFGLAVGAVLAGLAASGLRSLLFETSPAEATTHLGVVGLLLLAVLLACAVPALRAARVDPSKLMRLE